MPFIQTLPHGIHVIDTGFVQDAFGAAYLIVENGRAAYIDTGTRYAVPRLLAALDHVGLTPDAVDWLIVTHVHLDHAGGAGLLLQSLPQARFVVHPRGAPHMIDPSTLYEGARAVYGDEEMQRTYGAIEPVPAGRVLKTHDGLVLDLAGRLLLFIDTPGHARHHHAIWDERSRGFFTGDTFGLSYRAFDNAAGQAWVLPTTSPVQFEPEPLKASVRRILGFEPEHLYLTHYGPVGEVPRLGAEMIEQVDAMVAIALAAPAGAGRHEHLKRELAALYLDRVHAHGSLLDDAAALQALAIDIELNAQGLGIWLGRLKAAGGA